MKRVPSVLLGLVLLSAVTAGGWVSLLVALDGRFRVGNYMIVVRAVTPTAQPLPSPQKTPPEVQSAGGAGAPCRREAKVVSVVSPDTIKVVFTGDRTDTAYRLWYSGADGPQPADDFYQASLEENRRLVEGENIKVENCGRLSPAQAAVRGAGDDLGADVYVKGIHVNAHLVAQGYARSWSGWPLESLEREAKAKGVGLWRAWCADRSRFGAEDLTALFLRAHRETGRYVSLGNPYVVESLRRLAPSFADAWVFYSLRQEHLGQEPGSLADFFNNSLVPPGTTLNGFVGDYLKNSLVTEGEMAELWQVMESDQSCGAVFLNAPENQNFADRIRSGVGAR